MFFIYIIFIYSLLKNFLLVNTYDFKINIKDSILCEILEILRNTLIINTLIWTIIAIILNQNLYDIDPTGGRSGFSAFCGDRMVFGLIMATIYLSSFIIITNKKNIKLNLIIIGISILFILYSDSRTALSIVIIPTFFYLIKQKIKYVDFLILLISLILIVYMWNNFDDSITNEYSSGRIFVWSLFFKEFFPNNFIYGYGLFNFNDFILNKYMNLSYYFQRVDFLYFHSSYIEIWASGGILGIFSYILILYKTYINAKNSIKALLLGIIIGSFFESFIILPVFSISLLFWIIVIYENINFNEKRTS
jgi:O-antigen ligase